MAEAIKSASWHAKVRMTLSFRLVSSLSSLWDFVGGGRQVIRILRVDAPHGGQSTRNLVHCTCRILPVCSAFMLLIYASH